MRFRPPNSEDKDYGPFPTSAGRNTTKFFKALSDETRRNILHLLEHEDMTVTEIVARFEVSQPTISRHLSVLKDAWLVSDQRQGQRVLYRLSDYVLAQSMFGFFREFGDCRKMLLMDNSAGSAEPGVAEHGKRATNRQGGFRKPAGP